MANNTEPNGGAAPARGRWTSRGGFILAAAGSAVGLGNIWKFPYITGDYGGGAFVLVYLLCVPLVGLPLMIAEFMIGRSTQTNPVGAFQKLDHPRSLWQAPGWLGVVAGFLILSYYSVVGGWAIAYVFKSASGFIGTAEQIQSQFSALAGSPLDSIMWHTLFMALTMGIVIGGIQFGIERWSKILMPTLLLILVGLMFYGLFATDGGAAALSFLFKPDFSKLSAEAILSALGHAFFTLSLGMGAMITYGSYMRRGESLLRDAVTISILDTVIALFAGIAIFSLVFHYGMEPGRGVGLIFETLPVLFADAGRLISIPFFVLLSFAALTSAISLLEVVVSYFIDQKGWGRTRATLVFGGLIYLCGLLCAYESDIFGFLDVLTTNYMLPIGGLLICLFVAWKMKAGVQIEELGSRGPLFAAFRFVVRYITPVAVLVVILHGLKLLPFMSY